MPRSIRVNRTARMDVSESVSEKNDRTKSVHTSDGAFGFQVEARGTVKVGCSTWRYLRGAHFVIASNRIELGKSGKTELGVVLREAAHASETHCVSWPEIDAVGAMQCN